MDTKWRQLKCDIDIKFAKLVIGYAHKLTERNILVKSF